MYKFASRLSPGVLRPCSLRIGVAGDAAAAVLAALIAMFAMTAAANGATVRVVLRGLDNPRGLAFLPSGQLAVAEGGHAGSFCMRPGQCAGLSGDVIAVNLRTGQRTTLAAGLPSLGGPFGPFGLGGLTMRRGKLYAIVGENPQQFGSPTTDCKAQPQFDSCVATLRAVVSRAGNLDQLRSLSANQGWRTVARVGRFDYNYSGNHPNPGNPDKADGDPFGLIPGPSGGFYVVDGASNTLGVVTAGGHVSVSAFVPDPPHHRPIYDSAPTCAAKTPDGAVIIGTESGSLWRWKHRHLTRLLLGGKVGQVVSCVADARGNVYLGNLDSAIPRRRLVGNPSTGSVVKVTPDLRASYVAEGLNYPTGMTWGADRNLYITLNGLCPADVSTVNSLNAPPHACPASGEVAQLNGVTR